MKPYVFFLIFIFNAALVTAQTFPYEIIKKSGDDDKKINIVILSEGYQTSEFDKFIADATALNNTMFATSPFKEYANYFNVYAVKVPSNESGADHPGTGESEPNSPPYDPQVPFASVDTYFNTTYDAFDNHYLLYYEIDGYNANNGEALIDNVLMNSFPMYDQGILLVNSSYYGGSGGKYAVTYSGYWGPHLAIHEIGHSLFNLFDEYYPGDLLAAEAINMTKETDPALVKWKNWMNEDWGAASPVNIYQYKDSNGAPKNWYKPSNATCKMESVDKPFCPVCKEGIVEKIHELVSPINAFSPNNSAVVQGENFPIDFQLDVSKPEPNTIKSTWTLNNTDYTNGVDAVSVNEADLIKGTNTLTAVLIDDSNLLKVDNHESIHAHTVTWTINYSTLGLTTIEAEENKLNITLFPNPASSLITLKFESDRLQPLKVDIISMDGKKVMTLNLNALEHQQFDISHLNSGIYLTNFYAESTLIASKRLVKN
ncbi:M64 family metallopeptidase [Tamlana sp. I1]|uniref:T9SS type A sorting domain-containing protein n=1 Tax=Tamlana sp. I1 TaxID=2762061 RepID=UPI00188E546C|nr:M64 family metallopeptidase [Tamlana sp. I1]